MKALLTGASGFLGSAVLRRLIEEGHAVRALVRAGSDRRNLAGLAVESVTGDLSDPACFPAALDGCDALFHVAADYRLWVTDPARMYAVNVDGTRRLMRAALRAGIQRIVYTSSVATLGLDRAGGPADEQTPVGLGDMIGHYKRSKFMAEAMVRQMAAEKQLPVVIVNPSTPVGPRDVKPTPTGQMVLEAASGRMPAYVDTGLNIVHVDDVAQGHLLAFHQGRAGRRYILGGQNLTLREIFDHIAAISGRPAPRIRLPHNLILPVARLMQMWAGRTGTQPRVTVDGVRLAKKKMFFTCQRAETELGYGHRPVRAAFEDAIGWFRANGRLP
ncbi:MAG: NAD-dependent epimerase/dehydratase family protein [Desulfatitalea sp.]|nr:NAD-dependent epimerase/dehydratase family protein [Desulfatitalea sp.]